MNCRFKHHYTREEVRRLLPQVEVWLTHVNEARAEFNKAVLPMQGFHSDGCDVGGGLTTRYLQSFLQLSQGLKQFSRREIFIKDLDAGVIDFPSFAAGREVFLCWRRGELDVDHWHDLDSDFSGRVRI
ncbi:MAG: DUF2203 domain-containing protein [Verrucomicrobiales bacterium]